MNLATIELLVKERADQSSDLAFGLLFSKLKQDHIARSHLGYCTCTYCTALEVYTRARIRLHRVKKRLYSNDFHEIGIQQNLLFAHALHDAAMLKIEKDKAKET